MILNIPIFLIFIILLIRERDPTVSSVYECLNMRDSLFLMYFF